MKQKIAVLMATFNGEKYLSEQINSILSQKGVSVDIFVADDCSTDNTVKILTDYSKKNKNLKFFTNKSNIGPAKNFYSLLSQIPMRHYDFFSLSDQDDIWPEYRLARAIKVLSNKGCDGYSSDVMFFSSLNKPRYLKKSHNQKKYDYLFETPGPGCSFVFNKKLTTFFKEKLQNKECSFPYHDWLLYALARYNNYKWAIDKTPNLYYRQHTNNFMGANFGFKAGLKRINRILFGDYYKELIDLYHYITNGKKYNFITVIFYLLQFYHTRRKLTHSLLMIPFLLIVSIQKNEK